MKPKKNESLSVVQTCCRVLDEKKAGELAVLDVSEQSSITDYLILATATSEPHLRALRVEIEKALDAAAVKIVGIEARQESGWLVVDAFDVMIHLFLADKRELYGLERLWRDAVEVRTSVYLPSTKKKPVEKKTAAAKPRSPVVKKTSVKRKK